MDPETLRMVPRKRFWRWELAHCIFSSLFTEICIAPAIVGLIKYPYKYRFLFYKINGESRFSLHGDMVIIVKLHQANKHVCVCRGIYRPLQQSSVVSLKNIHQITEFSGNSNITYIHRREIYLDNHMPRILLNLGEDCLLLFCSVVIPELKLREKIVYGIFMCALRPVNNCQIKTIFAQCSLR